MFRCTSIETNADSLLQKTEVKELFSLRWVVVLLLLLSGFNGYSQETSLDNYTGDWSDDGSWVDGSNPGTNVAINVTINGYITCNGDLIFDDDTLTINDTLVVLGNLDMNNFANLVIGSAGILIVRGDYTSKPQVEVGNGGRMIVTGEFVMTGNNPQSTFENSGDLYIFDTTPDINKKETDLNCDVPEDCGVYDEDDLAANDPYLSDLLEEVINPNPAPVITTCAVDRTIFADASCQNTVPDLTGDVVATDDGTIVSITQSPIAGTAIGLGVNMVTIIVTDDGGKTAACTANVIVSDNTAPIPNVGLLSDVTAECSVTTLTAPTAMDNCDGEVIGTHNATLPITTQGTTQVIWTYTDAASNSSTQTQNVVIEDNTAPTFVAAPADVTVECAADIPAMTDLSWTDNCDGTGTVAGTDVSDGASNPETITRTWAYTDLGGNTAAVQQTIIIEISSENTIALSSAAGTDSQAVCINTAITDITYTTTGATGTSISGLPPGISGSWSGNAVTISGTPMASGTFNYTVTLTGGCGTISMMGAITVYALPAVGIQGVDPAGYC